MPAQADGRFSAIMSLTVAEMLNEADRVILLGYDVEKSFPATSVPTEVWPLDDPKDQPIEKIREVRDDIESRVGKLLQEFKG